MYHICFSNPSAWKISYQNGIYGNVETGNDNLKTFWSKIIDLVAIAPGDKIFFYVKDEMKLYGTFEVADIPYYCEDAIFEDESERYPFRFNFKEFNHFSNAIPIAELAKLIENGHISSITTFERDAAATFRGIRQITDHEAKIIEDTFYRFNPKGNSFNIKEYHHKKVSKIEDAYTIVSKKEDGHILKKPIGITLYSVPTHRVNKSKYIAQYENSLQGYIYYCIRTNSNNVISDLSLNNFKECLMEVPLLRAQQFRSDILCIYRNRYDEAHFFSIIETKKKKKISIEDLSQLIGYMKTFSSSKNIPFNSIEGLYISDEFEKTAIEYLRNRKSVEKENPIRLVEYSVSEKGIVSFNSIDI